jgi:predicted glycogen debranching enzyme
MLPVTGERLVRFVGDKILFTITARPDLVASKKWSARLRTNLGRAAARRQEIISAHAGQAVVANSSWRDIPMQRTADGWQIELPLAEVGYFKAKAYLLDDKNWQHWPDGSDVGISVHPDFTRSANTIYCAFTRLFGATKNLASTADEKLEAELKSLEAQGYATLPPSGTFRDLKKQLPFIVNQLGCRILHLLPVHPTPTTYARFGRFGSPYAALDLTAVDPALVEFDKRTTGIDQFCELTYVAHALNARVFIDIVINHTGWGSTLQENHPKFFLKKTDGEFASPGAWGTVWEDLVELEQHDVKLWDLIADSLITWCRRGVDGFRCDAGYKVPAPAWQYIVARVQEEFPETIFLLEGLGGSWDATELLLTEGGMQWAYSELFQNYSGKDVAWYLDYANRQNERVGSYVHYSETHDNSRLAAKKSDEWQVTSDKPSAPDVTRHSSLATPHGRTWSLLRNRLCALTSPSGGFGFTCGVEWLAAEKIRVHGNTGLNWDSADNIVPELAQLNQLITDHPGFFDGAKLTRLSAPDSPVYALLRESAEGQDSVLILANTDVERENMLSLYELKIQNLKFKIELLGQPLPKFSITDNKIVFTLAPGAVYCLAPTASPIGLTGEAYRHARARAAWALQSLSQINSAETVDGLDWQWLARQVERSPENLIAAASEFAARAAQTPFPDLLLEVESGKVFPRVVQWTLLDARRIALVPPGHWLLVEDSSPFRATLQTRKENTPAVHVQSIAVGDRHLACFAPSETAAETELALERYAATSQTVSANVRFLAIEPALPSAISQLPAPDALVLLTNGIGGMARLCVDLGRVNSKYDCALGANLNPTVPVDRHVFVKRLRVWVNADGFLSPLDFKNLASFQAGSPAVWNFVANAGDGRTVEIELRAEMPAGQNTTVFHFRRPTEKLANGKQLPAVADVRLTVRVDIEDRNFHSETKRNDGADFHFSANTREIQNSKFKIKNGTGFEFTPASDRQLRVFADAGEYHPQPEWCENIPHPIEQTRGQTSSGDAYSPGWFDIPLAKGADATLVLTAEKEEFKSGKPEAKSGKSENIFEAQLERAAKQFVVRRDAGKTVIAGYPWFLDWGRDSLICARGLLAAGMTDEVKQLLLTFAKFEKDGTLPNTIHGNDVSNRDTSDAPLWFAVVCEDLADKKFFNTKVDGTRTIRDVLTSIAENYAKGTPNGIRMDADSALIWSPSHFTWMDTNYPAGTPREGFPVEIQVLWIRLLRLLENICDKVEQKKWRDLADHALASFEKLFWLEDQGWFADVLIAKANVIARDATASDALRSNCLFAVSLGLMTGERAKRCVAAAQKYLVVPGALRSLAPLPVAVPLAIYRDGHLLNHPTEPYWPRYEGDEDTRRKPAYHNGTAWTWTFPTFCEALATAWDFSPTAVAAAKSYLGSSEKLLNEGCLGQLPEILDGDAPHTQRGCDAQAWGTTEALRVWQLLAGKVSKISERAIQTEN